MLLGIVIMLIMGITTPAYANHGIGSGSWTDGSVMYHCLGSLDNLRTTSYVSPCNDIADAVEVWNDINSTFELNEVQSNGESTYGAMNLASNTRGINSNTVSTSGGSVMTYANISFNTDHKRLLIIQS